MKGKEGKKQFQMIVVIVVSLSVVVVVKMAVRREEERMREEGQVGKKGSYRKGTKGEKKSKEMGR